MKLLFSFANTAQVHFQQVVKLTKTRAVLKTINLCSSSRGTCPRGLESALVGVGSLSLARRVSSAATSGMNIRIKEDLTVESRPWETQSSAT